jgi:nitroimidazol reductase NimA-like FMN-containing flavoprotein (pyridoxamine 5'-phosphate oxidase superfamily)
MTGDFEFLRKTFRDVPLCRSATVNPSGGPHVVPRWFVWLEDGLYVATRRGDASWEHVERDPRISVVVDRGRDWVDLAGVRLDGAAEAIPAEHPELRTAMSAWHEKYRSMLSGDGFERMTDQVTAFGFLRVLIHDADAWDHGAG